MAQVIVTNPSCIGIGIGENTAMVVRNGLEAEIIGSGLVIVIDGFHIGKTNVDDFLTKKPVSIRDLKYIYYVRVIHIIYHLLILRTNSGCLL